MITNTADPWDFYRFVALLYIRLVGEWTLQNQVQLPLEKRCRSPEQLLLGVRFTN